MSVDIDSMIASQISSFSQTVDDKLTAMSDNLFSKFSDLLGQFRVKMSNVSPPAEPKVSGRTPESGQSLPCDALLEPMFAPHQFQVTAEGPVPSGSGYAHLSHVSSGLGQV